MGLLEAGDPAGGGVEPDVDLLVAGGGQGGGEVGLPVPGGPSSTTFPASPRYPPAARRWSWARSAAGWWSKLNSSSILIASEQSSGCRLRREGSRCGGLLLTRGEGACRMKRLRAEFRLSLAQGEGSPEGCRSRREGSPARARRQGSGHFLDGSRQRESTLPDGCRYR